MARSTVSLMLAFISRITMLVRKSCIRWPCPVCCGKLKRRILSASKKPLAQSQTEEGHAYGQNYKFL